MFKAVTILYLVCFGAYLLFTREPDYFDGEKSPATIHWIYDKAAGMKIPKALFAEGGKEYAIDARYFMREWKEGETATVIYEPGKPEKAAVYLFWGYWLSWGELMATIFIYIALFQIAVSLTSNPTAESLMEQLDFKEEKKRKYDD